MKVDFRKSFLKDLEKLKNRRLKDSVVDVIHEIEKARELSDIRNLKN